LNLLCGQHTQLQHYKPTQQNQPHQHYFALHTSTLAHLIHTTANMKFNYLATASAVLVIANAAAIKFPRQLVTGDFQLQCNGTSGAECSKAWWTLCSVEGNIIMPAPATWKNGDCTHYSCKCLDAQLPVLTEAAVTHGSHTNSRHSATATFTRPHGTPQPHTVTVSPGSDATPIAGSYIWKRGEVERDDDEVSRE